MSKVRVLVVDDDTEILSLISEFLQKQGFDVVQAKSIAEFNAKIPTNEIDLIILDIMLPDGSGLDACRDLRTSGNRTPVILATAVGEEIDRIIGLEIGADDYLPKPYNPRELVARIKAVLRRTQGLADTEHSEASTIYIFEGFKLDPGARSVKDCHGNLLTFTSAEFDVLKAFMLKSGQIVSRLDIIEATHGKQGYDPFDRSVDVLISRVRKKLEDAGGRSDLLKTVRNSGYQFTARIVKSSGDA